MTARLWSDVKKKNRSPEHIARLDAEVQVELLQLSLREIREVAGKTQVELAEEAEMSQPQISQIEKQGAPLIASIRRYVRALGGDVEVVAVMGNKRITLAGI